MPPTEQTAVGRRSGALGVALLAAALTACVVVTGVSLARAGHSLPSHGASHGHAPTRAARLPGQPGRAAGMAQHGAHGMPAMDPPTAHGVDGAGEAGLAVAAGPYLLAPGPTRFTAGKAATFSFRIVDAAGRPVTRFQRAHTKYLHLIVVSRDLSGYQHLHPAMAGDGTWSTRLKLPAAGAWRAFADFATGMGAETLGVDLFAAGRFAPAAAPRPSSSAKVAGYTVAMRGAPALAGRAGELSFQVSAGGWPVADLEPYLGARGHLVAVREGDLAYLHVHAEDAATPGASLRFHTAFPSAGRYRLFLQFQHDGKVRTAAFTVQVH